MLPTIKQNEMLLIDTEITTFQNNVVYTILVNDFLLVKRIELLLNGKLLIKSDNENYTPQEASKSDVMIVGKLLSTLGVKNYV